MWQPRDVRGNDATCRRTSGGIVDEIEHRVRAAVSAAIGGKVDIGALGAGDDLFDAGMTSHQTVQVMLGLEDEFDLEFPDEDLAKSTFASIGSIAGAVSVLL